MNVQELVLPTVTHSKLVFISLILLLGFGLINKVAGDVREPGSSPLQFIVIGDWGGLNREGQKLVAIQMNELASHTPIDFIVSTGDNFYMKGVQSISDPLWKSAFENIYSLPDLKGIPWYVTLGNHDYKGNIYAQISYAKSHDNWILPQTYYSTEFKIEGESSVRFLFLDTNPFLEEYTARPDVYRYIETQDTVAQIKWMKEKLEGSNATWNIAVGHHPVYSSGYHEDTNSLKNVLPQLFEQQKVQAYFAGHDHHLEHKHMAGTTHYFISGGGSRIRPVSKDKPSMFIASSLGFAHVVLDSSCMQVRFINEAGVELYQNSFPASSEQSCQ